MFVVFDINFFVQQLWNEPSLKEIDHVTKFGLSFEFIGLIQWSGAGPELPIGGVSDPRGEGCQHIILPKFPKKLHDIEKILGLRGHPLGSTTDGNAI